MSSWHEFIFMGKHGAYVWSSYLMTFFVLLGLFFGFRIMLRSLRKQVIAEANVKQSDKPKARKLKVSKAE
ncbi:heme exporter protein CcmD [Kangiella sediminilitoris]|uniref:Heme exporter protein D n=1 Tax=Kangiella sediminilitoris TaxID=1144748 RepID=A0A1B3B9Y5_9GAMM|nr:heme exporter protein CcmD [Kangiella sediminilitoris]AOE49568.1 Heme exporter protein CcmD [Kangiella sediminilitoris]